jgi:hypothetical protein
MNVFASEFIWPQACAPYKSPAHARAFAMVTQKGFLMTASQLIELLKAAPEDAQVHVIAQTDVNTFEEWRMDSAKIVLGRNGPNVEITVCF